jgi:hypothetical protein
MDNKLFHQLCFYTMAHPDKAYFIHQHVVDAWQVQSAGADAKPIGIAFALVGLHLYLEKGYSGKEVRNAHVQLAKRKELIPNVSLPTHRGDITIAEVLKADTGPPRDAMIHQWCQSVWHACTPCHEAIKAYLQLQGHH